MKIIVKIIHGREAEEDEIEKMNWHERCELIQKEPVICAWHFNYQVQELIKLLKGKHQILGDMEEFTYRVEFQQRGSPHIHMLVWNKKAPTYVEDDDLDSLILYIDKYISCRKPSEEDEPELFNLVKTQSHRHTHTCRKGKNNTCRFNFPIPPMRSTSILQPYECTDKDAMKKLKENVEQIENTLKAMKMGEDISFDEFLRNLKMSEDDYIYAIRYNIKSPGIFLKRSPNEIRTMGIMKIYSKLGEQIWTYNSF